ncbi:hypothetical protein P4C99_21720 [Pontiellaceae bacterium B1224]|nr:hypothetical protein [Pontiellaceae bacterium B1224]
MPVKTKLGICVLASSLLFACKPADEPSKQEIAQTTLLTAKSISFNGNSLYTDGGSMGYLFKTDKNDDLILFLPIRFDERDFPVDVTNSTQEIMLTMNRTFNRTNLFSIERLSEEEEKLIKLVSDSTGEEYDPIYSKIRTNLIEIIETRNFPWGKSRPRKFEPAG